MVKKRKTRRLVPYVVLLVCLSLTVFAWLSFNNYNRQLEEERFQYKTNQISTAITKRMEDYATILRGGAALFAAYDDVTRTEWRTYVEFLNIGDTFPGLQGLGFSKVIQPSELAQHIQQIRAEGFPDYTVRPEGARDTYTSIIFLEPFDERNQQAFGYDMFSEPVRQAAMKHARDTGTISISGKVTLVQEIDQDVQVGFLMYVPVYTQGMPTNSVEERQTALQGYVYSPFRINNLINGIFPESLEGIDLEIFDGAEVSSSTLMYDSDESGRGLDEESTPKYFQYKTIDLYGHQWTLYFAAFPSSEIASAQFESITVLATGIVISLFVFFFTMGQEITRGRALALATKMTSSLRKSEEELRNSEAMWRGLVNASPESVFLTDPAGIVLAANDTTAQRLGKSVHEIIGTNVINLLPPEVADRRRVYVNQVIARDTPFRFEDIRNGRNLDNYIHPICDDDGKLTQIAFFGNDITERKRAEKELSSLNAELEQRVAERTAQLETSRNEAEKANRAKSEFLANMSHELRTPLNAINGFSEVLLEKYYGDLNEKQNEYVQDILESGNHLLSLINDILDLSKVEAGKEVLELSQLNLQSLLENSMVMIKEKSMKHNIALEIEIPSDLMNFQIIADQRKIKQVMYNLLSNAAKFTPDGGKISIEALRQKNIIQVSVSDTGIGLSKEEQGKVFDEFYQVRNEQEAKSQGTGLGLSLVKKYIEMHGGRILVESKGSGKGSKFSFTLPIKKNLPSK